MKILLIEPYYSGSHKQWADGFKNHSRNEIKILSLKGQFWKWRMHGGAVTIASKFNKMNQKDKIREIISKLVYEELCARGKAYRKARMAAGEKSSAYLSGRAVKVCKGQIKGAGGKKKKSYRGKRK